VAIMPGRDERRASAASPTCANTSAMRSRPSTTGWSATPRSTWRSSASPMERCCSTTTTLPWPNSMSS
jgi:hypothetical protein